MKERSMDSARSDTATADSPVTPFKILVADGFGVALVEHVLAVTTDDRQAHHEPGPVSPAR